MGRVVHFEITADDLARAEKFYQIFDWKIEDSGMPGGQYKLAKSGDSVPGVDGAIMPRSFSPQPVILTISVDSIDEMVEKIKSAGGQTAGEKQTIPEVGDFIYCLDTEGNKFGILQPLARQ